MILNFYFYADDQQVDLYFSVNPHQSDFDEIIKIVVLCFDEIHQSPTA